jgi:hypothetical protein
MKLNILTVLFRKEFLEKQMESIPNRSDINWIICKTKAWGELHKKIKNNGKKFSTLVAEVDCEETIQNFVTKINKGMSLVQDGFFYLLDDDNIIHENMIAFYDANKKYDMIIGNQVCGNGKIKIFANIPEQDGIDMGNVICTTRILKDVDYFNCVDKSISSYDGQFWMQCYSKLKKENVLLTNNNIFYYNGLR